MTIFLVMTKHHYFAIALSDKANAMAKVDKRHLSGSNCSFGCPMFS
jgi:hypothetical protein